MQGNPWSRHSEKKDLFMNQIFSPLVSVIIPTYNRGALVCEALDSVLGQTYGSLDVIVVDDGSTDDSFARLEAYGNRIHLIHQENKGVSGARNAGIRIASGDYIAFLDSDDLWEKDKINAQVGFFRNNPHALICQSQEIWIRNGKRVNPMNKHKKLTGMIFEPSLHLCLVSPSAVMIKRALLDEIGLFDEALLACEDYDLWLRISSRYPIYTTDEKHVIKKGGHEDQLSRAPGLDRYRIRSLLKILKQGTLNPAQAKAARDVLIEKCRIYAQGCKKRGKDQEALYYESIRDAQGCL